jgi:DNA-binding MarR family transcriptional regulator
VTPLQRRHTRRHRIRQLAKEIHNAAACLHASQSAICRQTGLSAERWKALAVIDRSSFTLSISDLARQLRRSRQSVHPLALNLEKAGWIRFLPNRDDRRLMQMEITPRGKSVLATAEDRFNGWLLTMASDLDDRELRALVDTLCAVRDRIARARDYA